MKKSILKGALDPVMVTLGVVSSMVYMAWQALPKRTVLMLAVVCVFSMFAVDVYAQGGGLSTGLSSVSSQLTGAKTIVKTICNTIGAMIVFIGGMTILFKMTNGDQDVKKAIMLTVGGALAMYVAGNFLPMIFE